jgi:Uncharacterized homolog of Blt101
VGTQQVLGLRTQRYNRSDTYNPDYTVIDGKDLKHPITDFFISKFPPSLRIRGVVVDFRFRIWDFGFVGAQNFVPLRCFVPQSTIPNSVRRFEMDIVRIILAVILPPLGVFLQVGLGKHFWLNILLTLLGYIPGIVHAIWVIAKK